LFGGGWWWYRRSQNRADPSSSPEDYLQAIAELDDDYAAGQVEAGSYARERKELKNELLRLMKSAGSQRVQDEDSGAQED
jgi:hypothetical protein